MRIAFYAPLKPPDHPTPSGDRRMARLLMDALESGRHTPILASRFRSRDAEGDPDGRIEAAGAEEAKLCLATLKADPPAAWLTYHLYHKAPDWLGPPIARALGIPYIVAEASLAPKRATGPFARGHRAVADALNQAAAVLALSRLDMECLVPATRHLLHFPPFLDARPFDRPRRGDGTQLLAVGMMRADVKLRSYRLLAAAMTRIADRRWRLRIVGDGPARAEIEATFAPLGDRVQFLGAVAPEALPPIYAAADLVVWPAVDEAFGMALLEAQAAGTPVVAGGYGGVPEVIADGISGIVTPPGDVAAFAGAVASLLDDPARLRAMSQAARDHIRNRHGLPEAARRLDAILASVAR
ncbi:MAG: glycosyltransferase family 4 protein [Alphaproteobacteria bacterium]|nr:glycosyltransferase family 4 protein [Alphaproteobacteria bacterium]